jgi:hypothetical protein
MTNSKTVSFCTIVVVKIARRANIVCTLGLASDMESRKDALKSTVAVMQRQQKNVQLGHRANDLRRIYSENLLIFRLWTRQLVETWVWLHVVLMR